MVESIYSNCIEADIFEWSQLERHKRPLRPNVATLTSANVSFMKDAVEKVAALLFQIAGEKIDLSDRPINRWRMPVKGKKTPENLVRDTVSDFFNSM